MSPKPIDRRQGQHGLTRLDVLLTVHPELREPEAQARFTAWLAQEQWTAAQEKRARTQTGDVKTRVRRQRLREKRKQAGMTAYELRLDPETAAVLARLKHPRESLTHLIRRAVLTVKAQDMPEAAEVSVERPARGQDY
jgi:hypothetical protein